MIIKKNQINRTFLFNTITSLINDTLSPSDFVFFDIETTGLEASSSALYLIGYMCIENNELVLTQLFSESFSEQSDLINEFQRVVDTHKCLIHFNGQTFDIPYLEKKGCTFNDIISYDIYRELKNFKGFLGLNSMKQKSLEKYVGLNREDIYDGGALIEFYLKYLATNKIKSLQNSYKEMSIQNEGLEFKYIYESGLPYLKQTDKDYLLETLLLHNYEDVEGMLDVSKLISIIPKNLPRLLKLTIEKSESYTTIVLNLLNSDFLPLFNKVFNKFNLEKSNSTYNQILLENTISFNYSNGLFTLKLYPYTGILKQFFSNYKDYCYLPAEDKVIPKEIAKFMDKSLYKKATADNCYTPYDGTFIPAALNNYPDINKHFFRESSNSPIIYILDKEFDSLTPEELIQIAISLFVF